MKFKKGQRVCAVLVANKWGVDFTCFCGRLIRIEEDGAKLTATIAVTTYFDLYVKDVHKPTKYTLDIRLFKLLPWNAETRTYVKQLRKASQILHRLACKVRPVKQPMRR